MSKSVFQPVGKYYLSAFAYILLLLLATSNRWSHAHFNLCRPKEADQHRCCQI